jgi:dTDP-4-dehydrorhamnose 3,5-epimerase
MKFTETSLAGAYLIEPAAISDERGYFARTWAPEAFTSRGLDADLAQCNVAWNRVRGTLRGLHFQREPFSEVKLVRCTRGAILDVIVDLRPDSPTYCRWESVELRAEQLKMFYVPKGFAHGYLTLTDNAEVHYQVSAPYSPSHASGVPWNDPSFGIIWPFQPTVISVKDQNWSPFEPTRSRAPMP